jgi:hypothetical protein
MCDDSESEDASLTQPHLQVFLDGLPVRLGPQPISLASIRFQLETMALEKNRILCAIKIDGIAVNLADSLLHHGPFARVEAETIDVEQMPLQLIQSALRQCAQVKGHLTQAVARVMINNGSNALHLWWGLASELKHPLVTLSLLSSDPHASGPSGDSVLQLRNRQLQQLAAIIKEIDKLPCSEDPTALSDALERRVFPWLVGLEQSLTQTQEAILARQWDKSGIAAQSLVSDSLPTHGISVSFFGKPCP